MEGPGKGFEEQEQAGERVAMQKLKNVSNERHEALRNCETAVKMRKENGCLENERVKELEGSFLLVRSRNAIGGVRGKSRRLQGKECLLEDGTESKTTEKGGTSTIGAMSGGEKTAKKRGGGRERTSSNHESTNESTSAIGGRKAMRPHLDTYHGQDRNNKLRKKFLSKGRIHPRE